jgi:hypothetical protein
VLAVVVVVVVVFALVIFVVVNHRENHRRPPVVPGPEFACPKRPESHAAAVHARHAVRLVRWLVCSAPTHTIVLLFFSGLLPFKCRFHPSWNMSCFHSVTAAQFKKFVIAFRVVFYTRKRDGSIPQCVCDPVVLLENLQRCVPFASVQQKTQQEADCSLFRELVQMVNRENAVLQEESNLPKMFCPSAEWEREISECTSVIVFSRKYLQ